MADIEKVIKGLEYCIADEYCDECPYTDDCFAIDDKPYGEKMLRDALELLTEQQKKPVKPRVAKAIYDPNCWYYVCGECSMPIDIQDNFCKHCGRPVEH